MGNFNKLINVDSTIQLISMWMVFLVTVLKFERVDVSFDGGKTWVEASRYQKTGNPYVTEKVAKAVSYYCSLINITFVEVYTINLMLVHQAKS